MVETKLQAERVKVCRREGSVTILRKVGYLVRNFPELLSEVTQEEQEIVEDTGSVTMANVTIHAIATLDTTVPLGPSEFLMDSESQVSVARYEFLDDIYSSPSGFQGLHGGPTRVEHKYFYMV